MTGRFSAKDPARCAHYARFFKHLTLVQAEMIFWLLFMTVLILMSIASIFHHKSAALTAKAAALPPSLTSRPQHPLSAISIRRTRVRYLAIVSLILLLSATCTVIECFAAFNIEYCDGEDLMQLYWGFWSILQVGSNIAIMGVMLQFWIVLGDVETPSWAVALGTPVLVFAAAGFILKALWGKILVKVRGNKIEKSEQSGDEEAGVDEDVEKNAVGRWVSQAPTIRNNNLNDMDESDAENQPPSSYPQATFANGRTTCYAPDAITVQPQQDPNFREGNPSHATSFWSRDLHGLFESIITEPATPRRAQAERHPPPTPTLTGDEREREQRRLAVVRSYSVPL